MARSPTTLNTPASDPSHLQSPIKLRNTLVNPNQTSSICFLPLYTLHPLHPPRQLSLRTRLQMSSVIDSSLQAVLFLPRHLTASRRFLHQTRPLFGRLPRRHRRASRPRPRTATSSSTCSRKLFSASLNRHPLPHSRQSRHPYSSENRHRISFAHPPQARTRC